MKTDTEDTIRVTVTFRRESHPEWYETLIEIRSGRARAEIVRAALTLPRARPASRTVRPPVTYTAKTKPLIKPELKPTDDIPKATATANGTVADAPLEKVTTEVQKDQQPAGDVNVGDIPCRSIRRGGMADELLDMGL